MMDVSLGSRTVVLRAIALLAVSCGGRGEAPLFVAMSVLIERGDRQSPKHIPANKLPLSHAFGRYSVRT